LVRDVPDPDDDEDEAGEPGTSGAREESWMLYRYRPVVYDQRVMEDARALSRDLAMAEVSGHACVGMWQQMGLAVTSHVMKEGHLWGLFVGAVPVAVRVSQVMDLVTGAILGSRVVEAVVVGPASMREDGAAALATLCSRLQPAVALFRPDNKAVTRGRKPIPAAAGIDVEGGDGEESD